MLFKGRQLWAVLLLLVGGCASTPPDDPDDICKIFREERGWYNDAHQASQRWGAPIPVMMSFMYQESAFHSHAKPPRTKILWVIPWRRPSARGYSQATRETWNAYKHATGRWIADRNDFDDAIDFMGWYIYQSHRANSIATNDAYHLYLAYHEGQGGYARQTWKKKKWLMATAKKVAGRANTYTAQLKGCEKEFQRPWFIRMLPFF